MSDHAKRLAEIKALHARDVAHCASLGWDPVAKSAKEAHEHRGVLLAEICAASDALTAAGIPAGGTLAGRVAMLATERDMMRDVARGVSERNMLARDAADEFAALARLADPALRAAFNAYPGLPPRIVVQDGTPAPEHRGRGKGIRDLRRMGAQTLEDVATALRISIPDVSSLERGKKTTDDEGWREITTVLFALGGGMKAEEIADPIGSGALDRALAAADDDEPAIGDEP